MDRIRVLFLWAMLYIIPLYCFSIKAIEIDDDSLSVLHDSAFNYAKQGDYVNAIRIEQENLINGHKNKCLYYN